MGLGLIRTSGRGWYIRLGFEGLELRMVDTV